jgi:hypothetical protein
MKDWGQSLGFGGAVGALFATWLYVAVPDGFWAALSLPEFIAMLFPVAAGVIGSIDRLFLTPVIKSRDYLRRLSWASQAAKVGRRQEHIDAIVEAADWDYLGLRRPDPKALPLPAAGPEGQRETALPPGVEESEPVPEELE